MQKKKIIIIGLVGRYYKIVSSAENYIVILSKLCDERIIFELDNRFGLLSIIFGSIKNFDHSMCKEISVFRLAFLNITYLFRNTFPNK